MSLELLNKLMLSKALVLNDNEIKKCTLHVGSLILNTVT